MEWEAPCTEVVIAAEEEVSTTVSVMEDLMPSHSPQSELTEMTTYTTMTDMADDEPTATNCVQESGNEVSMAYDHRAPSAPVPEQLYIKEEPKQEYMQKNPGKKGKNMNSKEEPDLDKDIASYVPEVNDAIQRDVQKIPVKQQRKLIPVLRVLAYMEEDKYAGKKKLKHLWDHRPADWPKTVPFLDPNNGRKNNNPGKTLSDSEKKKPGKDELSRMFVFLKNKYLKKIGHNNPSETMMVSTTEPMQPEAEMPAPRPPKLNAAPQQMVVAMPATPTSVQQFTPVTMAQPAPVPPQEQHQMVMQQPSLMVDQKLPPHILEQLMRAPHPVLVQQQPQQAQVRPQQQQMPFMMQPQPRAVQQQLQPVQPQPPQQPSQQPPPQPAVPVQPVQEDFSQTVTSTAETQPKKTQFQPPRGQQFTNPMTSLLSRLQEKMDQLRSLAAGSSEAISVLNNLGLVLHVSYQSQTPQFIRAGHDIERVLDEILWMQGKGEDWDTFVREGKAVIDDWAPRLQPKAVPSTIEVKKEHAVYHVKQGAPQVNISQLQNLWIPELRVRPADDTSKELPEDKQQSLKKVLDEVAPGNTDARPFHIDQDNGWKNITRSQDEGQDINVGINWRKDVETELDASDDQKKDMLYSIEGNVECEKACSVLDTDKAKSDQNFKNTASNVARVGRDRQCAPTVNNNVVQTTDVLSTALAKSGVGPDWEDLFDFCVEQVPDVAENNNVMPMASPDAQQQQQGMMQVMSPTSPINNYMMPVNEGPNVQDFMLQSPTGAGNMDFSALPQPVLEAHDIYEDAMDMI